MIARLKQFFERPHPWAGFFGGFVAWYGAHEIGTYLSDYHCRHPWILPTVHVLALVADVYFGILSSRSLPSDPRDERALTSDVASFGAAIGTGSAAIFSVVILWQAVATFIYSGCER